jgi:hypothetical protein
MDGTVLENAISQPPPLFSKFAIKMSQSPIIWELIEAL